MHAGITHALQGIDAILVVARADDVAVELGGCVEVMVVVVETGQTQLLGLLVIEHAQRGTGLHTQRFDLLHHLHHGRHVFLARFAPGGAHAESVGSGVLRSFGSLDHFLHFQHLAVLHACVVERGLRTVAAVLGTATGLDRQQGGELHRVRIEMLAVHLLRLEQQVGERQLEQLFDSFNAPALWRCRCSGFCGTNEGDRLALHFGVCFQGIRR